MGSDKKRKLEKEAADAGVSSMNNTTSANIDGSASKKQKKDKKDKKESKEKSKEKKKEKKESKDEKKDKKDKKDKEDKKDKKDKNEKKETKEKKEKKDNKEKKESKEKKNSKNEIKVDKNAAKTVEIENKKKRSAPESSSSSDAGSDSGSDMDSAANSKSSSLNGSQPQAMAMDIDVISTTHDTVTDNAVTSVQDDQKKDKKKENSVDSTTNGGNSKPSAETNKEPKRDANGLTRQERQQLKKEAFLAKKAAGKGPSITLKEPHGEIYLTNIRDFIVYTLTETPALSWLEVKNKASIDKVVLLYIAGMDPKMFHMNLKKPEQIQYPFSWIEKATSGPVTEFQQLKNLFSKVNTVKAAGDQMRIHSPTHTLLNVPLSNAGKQKRDLERQKNKTIKMIKPEQYLLTLQDLKENEFPIPTYLDDSAPPLAPGWIETPKIAKTTLSPTPKTMIAIDCEMCRTEAGQELTRVSLISMTGDVILDELVLPENPILDYLTQYSGMTATRLRDVTTRLADVQKRVQQIVGYNTILVGHSLENDMQVLKMAHPFIIDTSISYHHTRGPPYRPGLKWLAWKWLNRQIQANTVRGHDSVEDALACMDLMKLKLTKPPGFGEFSPDYESLFSRLNRFNKPRTSALIDSDAFAGQSAQTTIRTGSDAEVVAAVPEAIKNHNFVWARLRDLEINHGKNPPLELAEGQLADTGRASKI
ncbi:hypothetical protein BG004_003339, partial [Podila humilis]